MTGSTTKTGLSRPSSSGQGNGRDQAAPLTSKDVDEGTGVGADESMSLSSPTNHLRNPMLKGMRKGNDTTKEGGGEEEVMGDVSMDESDDGVDEMEGDGRDVLLQNEDKLTSEMNADERREKLRRRTAGRKAGKDIAE